MKVRTYTRKETAAFERELDFDTSYIEAMLNKSAYMAKSIFVNNGGER